MASCFVQNFGFVLLTVRPGRGDPQPADRGNQGTQSGVSHASRHHLALILCPLRCPRATEQACDCVPRWTGATNSPATRPAHARSEILCATRRRARRRPAVPRSACESARTLQAHCVRQLIARNEPGPVRAMTGPDPNGLGPRPASGHRHPLARQRGPSLRPKAQSHHGVRGARKGGGSLHEGWGFRLGLSIAGAGSMKGRAGPATRG
jgi:hypothetical protein